ncbi:hypothetical protein [Cellulosimicrobium sp. CUA-896]|uniref:hypothetical protein n=1 Tax=Cellulosimicrobium sp. CUA-896 TaxID=1517881 RepID=UPI0011150931|nr:hypothetical protein [Cellulosimicrobium sp. CUA-896]
MTRPDRAGIVVAMPVQTLAQSDGVDLFLPAAYDVAWSAVVLLLVVGAVVAVVLVVRALLRTPPRPVSLHDVADADPVRRSARRHAATVAGGAAGLAALVGIVGSQAVATVDGLAEGVLVGLSPALVALAFLAAHAIGERTWPTPRTAVRSATLRHRTVGDVAPRRLRHLTWAFAALVVVLAAVGAATAGDEGRSVTRVAEASTSTASPYPGAFYGVWLALGAVTVLAASEGVLRLVARRPAVPHVGAGWDVALRRLSAHRVLRGVQLALGLTAAGTLGTGASAAARVGYPGAVVLVAVAALLALATVAVVVQPAPDPDAWVGTTADEDARAVA